MIFTCNFQKIWRLNDKIFRFTSINVSNHLRILHDVLELIIDQFDVDLNTRKKLFQYQEWAKQYHDTFARLIRMTWRMSRTRKLMKDERHKSKILCSVLRIIMIQIDSLHMVCRQLTYCYIKNNRSTLHSTRLVKLRLIPIDHISTYWYRRVFFWWRLRYQSIHCRWYVVESYTSVKKKFNCFTESI